MRRHTLATCSLLFVTICCALPSRARFLTDVGPRDNDIGDISEYSLDNRQKRAAHIIIGGTARAGKRALDSLIKGAKRMPPKERYREFEKSGSLTQALEDFRKLKLFQEHEFNLPGGGIGIAGQVGDRQFILQNTGDLTLIDVIQIQNDWIRRITTRVYYND